MISQNAKEVLKNSNFLKLWLCQFLSIFVASLLNFALVVRIFEVTNANIPIALFWIVYQLPTVILGLAAGVFVDYFPKRKILIYTNLIQGTVALSYLTLKNEVWLIFGLVFLYSLVDEFFRPAQESSLPLLVKGENLHFANSFMVLTLQGAALLGATSAGPLLHLSHSFNLPFLVGPPLLYLAAIFAALIPAHQIRNTFKNRAGNGLSEFFVDLKQGVKFVRQTSKVRNPLCLATIFQVASSSLIVLGPALADQVFNLDLRDVGLTLILPAAIGGALASFLIDRWIILWGRANLVRFGFITSSLSFAAIPLLNQHLMGGNPLTVTLAFLTGVSAVAVLAPLKTAIQINSPPDIRGRVFGALRTLVMLVSGVAVLISSLVADFANLYVALEIVCLSTLVSSLLFLRRDDAV